MSRKHLVVIPLLVALAAIAGLVALAQTMHLGAQAHAQRVSTLSVERRSQALDRLESSLRVALAKKPPNLPAVPAAPESPARAPRVTYVRPAPIVVHRPAGGGEREDDGRERAEGGGLDD